MWGGSVEYIYTPKYMIDLDVFKQLKMYELHLPVYIWFVNGLQKLYCVTENSGSWGNSF